MDKSLRLGRSRRWLRRHTLLILGSVLLLVGIAVLAAVGSGGGSESFGWFAYAPLPRNFEVSTWTARSATLTIIGSVSLAAGLATLAGSIGYRLGLRKATL